MIRLKRLNGTDFVLNCDLIKLIESTPDTMITLLSGEKLMVRESLDAVITATMQYKKRLFQEPLQDKQGEAVKSGEKKPAETSWT